MYIIQLHISQKTAPKTKQFLLYLSKRKSPTSAPQMSRNSPTAAQERNPQP